MRRLGTICGAVLLLAAGLAGPIWAAAPAASSLPAVAGPRPGPDILYEPVATAPQLTNAGVWKAPSILVSGATAYRDGEFIYQDFLDDDHGAVEQPDPQDQRTAGNLFSKPDGTYTYPTDAKYANNVADLAEFRVKAVGDATAFRATFGTMTDPSLVAFSLAIGGAEGVTHPFPFGANVSSPADLFLTVHASGSGLAGDLTQAASGATVWHGAATADVTRDQVEIDVPHSAWDPGAKTARMALGVGLWDKANNRYLLPGPTQSATAPGGAGLTQNPPAFFNVGFRSNQQEPFPTPTDVVNSALHQAWWRDREQGEELASGDITGLHAEVDFAKLLRRVDDESGVPRTGAFDRILQSHFGSPRAGNDWSVSCFPAATSGGSHCASQMHSNLQPYAVYVPATAPPAAGYGLTLQLHSLSAQYNQYLGTRNQSQFAHRGTGSITITPEGRGPDGFYDAVAGADTFEVWADVARLYHLDPDWTVVTGYSMGGMGSFKLAEEFPDLFAKMQPTVGYSAVQALVPSLRNIPVRMWNMATDELVNESQYYPTAKGLDDAGYRYELDVFAPGEHLTLAINDQFAPAAAFLGTTRVDRNPGHITFVVDPALDYPEFGFVADHAYWLSGIRERDKTQATGTIDVISRRLDLGDPAPSATAYGTGQLTGGTLPAIAYASQARTWGAPGTTTASADELDITATNVSAITVDVGRAGVDCGATLKVTSDGPLAVTLAGCVGGAVQTFNGAQAVPSTASRSDLAGAQRPRGAVKGIVALPIHGDPGPIDVRPVRSHRNAPSTLAAELAALQTPMAAISLTVVALFAGLIAALVLPALGGRREDA